MPYLSNKICPKPQMLQHIVQAARILSNKIGSKDGLRSQPSNHQIILISRSVAELTFIQPQGYQNWSHKS